MLESHAAEGSQRCAYATADPNNPLECMYGFGGSGVTGNSGTVCPRNAVENPNDITGFATFTVCPGAIMGVPVLRNTRGINRDTDAYSTRTCGIYGAQTSGTLYWCAMSARWSLT